MISGPAWESSEDGVIFPSVERNVILFVKETQYKYQLRPGSVRTFSFLAILNYPLRKLILFQGRKE